VPALWQSWKKEGANIIDDSWSQSFFVVARNFRILHPSIKDAEPGQIRHFFTMPGEEHFNSNYNVDCLALGYSCCKIL
jgi:hypothetical protein